MKNETEKLIKACIKQLKEIEVTLSGDDSGLNNCWEEICVQMQGEESFSWDVYIETINEIIDSCIKKMGYNYPIEFYLEQHDVDEEYREEEFKEYKTEVLEQILRRAEDYSNTGINNYLNR